jgi:hypothetical protein
MVIPLDGKATSIPLSKVVKGCEGAPILSIFTIEQNRGNSNSNGENCRKRFFLQQSPSSFAVARMVLAHINRVSRMFCIEKQANVKYLRNDQIC